MQLFQNPTDCFEILKATVQPKAKHLLFFFSPNTLTKPTGPSSPPVQVSFEDVERLRQLATFSRTRVPHFMRDQERYLQHLDHIVAANELDDAALQQLLPEPSSNTARCPEDVG